MNDTTPVQTARVHGQGWGNAIEDPLRSLADILQCLPADVTLIEWDWDGGDTSIYLRFAGAEAATEQFRYDIGEKGYAVTVARDEGVRR